MKDEYFLFLDLFREKAGIDLSHYNQAQMYRRLTTLKDKLGYVSFSEFLEAVQLDEDLFISCLGKLTVNVTGFFRDTNYWQVLKDKMFHMAAYKPTLKIWSAACATGEEAWSLGYFACQVGKKSTVIASDIDKFALSTARAGVYSEKALKNMDKHLGTVMFRKIDSTYHIRDRIRERVQFFKHDLTQDSYPTDIDIILCRNVLIYFNEKAKREVYEKMANALAPGGLLFLGASEQIMSPRDYGLVNEDLYFYRK